MFLEFRNIKLLIKILYLSFASIRALKFCPYERGWRPMGGLDGDLGHLGAHAADSKVLFIKNLSQQPFFFFFLTVTIEILLSQKYRGTKKTNARPT